MEDISTCSNFWEFWINTRDFPVSGLIWNAIGCVGWVFTYAWFLYSMRKNKFVEMPFFIACGNLAWEFLWTFYVNPSTGKLYAAMYAGAFLMDCYIFWHVLKNGHKQIVGLPIIQKHFKAIAVACLLGWTVIQYFFIKEGYDTCIGANSGYILNLIISILYPILLMRVGAKPFSIEIAWGKNLGTAFITVSMFIFYPENHFVQSLGVACFILDSYYCYLLHTEKRKLAQTQPNVA